MVYINLRVIDSIQSKRGLKMKTPSINTNAKEDRPKIAFTSVSTNKQKSDNSANKLNKKEQELVDGYKTMLYSIAYNNHPRFKHVGTRCSELNSLAEQFKTGYPWKNNERLVKLATPQLVNTAVALASRLEMVEKAKNGRDLGRVDG